MPEDNFILNLHNQEINDLMSNFKGSSNGLLNYTFQEMQRYENGIYGVAFAKPSRRLASMLAVDRELLILFSNFAEQQARTIQFAKKLIGDSEARLESTVAIIVHKDRDRKGNTKLKNWGREIGIAILPVNAADNVPKNEDLQRHLKYELFSHDPFDITGPVSDDTQFYGRRSEAQDLARKLQTGQIRTCLGIRKIGKTSILNRVLGETRANHDCICIMIDCSKDMVWEMSAAQLMASIAQAIRWCKQNEAGYCTVEENSTESKISICAKDMEDLILDSDRPIILFMDEVDYITPSNSTGHHWKNDFNVFWRNLRAVYQEIKRHNSTLSLLIGGVSSRWFRVGMIEGVENAALTFVPEEYVSPLPRGATKAMLKSLARRAGLQFDDNALERIAEVCADMPYWVRKASSYIHDKTEINSRPLKLESDQVATLLEEFVSYEGETLAKVALSHLFSVHPELERHVKACSDGKAETVPKSYLSVLEKYGVIYKPPQFGTPDSAYGISGLMMRKGLKLYLEDQDSVNSARNGVEIDKRPDESINELGEWAEELALISKRRNLLEKRLRQVCLNFIKLDSLNDRKKPASASRISVVIGGVDDRKIANLSADEMIEKFNWTDLEKLVDREWPLFSRVFGDKKQFKEDCNIINERYDAHAKDFDPADMALYRRRLKRLEDALSKL
jgi:AAA-like domain